MLSLRGLYLVLFICLFSCSENKSQTSGSGEAKSSEDDKGRQSVIIAITDSSQEPLVFEDGSGVSNDIVTELNKIQNKYAFTHELVPTKRMKELAATGKVNIVAFSNVKWGWNESQVQSSEVLVNDKDLYFSLKEEGRGQSFFDSFKSLSIVGVKGFHYNFNKNESTFIGVQDEKAVIDLLLLKRGDIGVASSLNLQHLSLKKPEVYSRLLVADKYDSVYTRSFLVVNGGPISVEELNKLLYKMRSSGALKRIYDKYGL